MTIPMNQNLIAIEGSATYERILALVRDVETGEAIQHIHDFLKIYPEFSQAHSDIALLFHRTGNALKALAHHEKAHKLDPANVAFRKNLAHFYFAELEWTGEAIQTYLDILKDNPFDIEALNALGSVSLQIGRKEQARQYYTRTLQLDGTNREARQALQQLGAMLEAPVSAPRVSETLALGRTVPVTGVSAPAARVSTPAASVSAPAARVSTPAASVAAPVFQPFPSASPDIRVNETSSPDELYREAVSLATAGKDEEAILKLEALLRQNSDHALAHNDLGVLLCRNNNDLEGSLHHHEEAARLKPSNTVFRKNLADLLCVKFGRYEDALRIYVSIQARMPQDIDILKAISFVCWKVGQSDKTRFFLEKVLDLQPWDREAQEALAQLETE